MKKLALIGGTIFLCGVILAVTAFALGGWKIQNMSTRPAFETKYESYDNENQNITLSDKNANVVIGKSDDEKIHITYMEREKEYYDIDTNNGIKFTRILDFRWYENIFTIYNPTPVFTLLLPDDYSGHIDMRTTNGNINMKNAETVSSVNLKTTNGIINAENLVTAGNFIVNSTNGDIKLKNIAANNITGNTTNGEITTDTTEANLITDLRTTNGSISITGMQSGTSISLKSTNGGIRGTISGNETDFSISSGTTNGTNNLNPYVPGRAKTLTVNTTNGRINITFTN